MGPTSRRASVPFRPLPCRGAIDLHQHRVSPWASLLAILLRMSAPAGPGRDERPLDPGHVARYGGSSDYGSQIPEGKRPHAYSKDHHDPCRHSVAACECRVAGGHGVRQEGHRNRHHYVSVRRYLYLHPAADEHPCVENDEGDHEGDGELRLV